MNGSIPVFLVQRKCTLHNVLWRWCSLWRKQWRGNSAPRCTSRAYGNAAYYCTFVQHHLRPAPRRKRWHLVVQNPIILHNNARSHNAAAITDLLRRWQREIVENPPYSPDMSPCDYSLRQSERTAARDPVLHKRWTYTCNRAVNMKHQQRWTRWWCTIPFKYLAKVINKWRSRGNVVASHPVGQNSIPGRDNFLVKIYSRFFFDCVKCQEI